MRKRLREQVSQQQLETDPTQAEQLLREGDAPAEQPQTSIEQDNPQDADPGETDVVAELQAKVVELQKNYDNLRSYADRVSGENRSLRDENDLLNSQMRVLLADRQRGGQQPPAAETPTTPRDQAETAQIPAQRADESDEDYLSRLTAKYRDLQEADADFSHIVRPLLRVIRDLETRVVQSEQNLRQQLDPVVQSMKTEIQQNAQERQRTAAERYFAAIADKHPDYHTTVTSEAFAEFINSHPLGQTYHQLLWPEEWGEGYRRGTAQEVIGILDVFKAHMGQGAQTPGAEQEQRRAQQAEQRRLAAEEAVEPSVRSTVPVPQGDGEVIRRSDIIKWSKDPQLWKQNKQRVQEARMHGRIFEDVR